MDLGLGGTRALVFGSTAGMGRAIAASLAREGASVFVTGRDESRLATVSEEIGAAGYVRADLGEPGAA
ncbi:MAG: SDR family NAD(P)-dependent oxidoreductase, partial [Acidimicrobiia bacterium]|nr:SDR family NAD(P)-dependent oxidoreductase [Acidimicrobiia bacterium]